MLNEKYYSGLFYWARAVDVIKTHGNSLQVYDFLAGIGIGKEGYTEHSLKRGSRIIRNRFDGFTLTELKEFIANNVLPERYEANRKKYEEILKLKADPDYYTEKAIKLIKQNKEKYDRPMILLQDLGGMGYSWSTIETQSDRCLKRELGYNLKELKYMALNSYL